MTVDIDEAQTRLTELVEKVQAGEEVVIAQAGQPVAKLVFVAPPLRQRRVPGSARGQFTMADDFDNPLPEEILREFES